MDEGEIIDVVVAIRRLKQVLSTRTAVAEEEIIDALTGSLISEEDAGTIIAYLE